MTRGSKRPASPPASDDTDHQPPKRTMSLVIPAYTPPPPTTPEAQPGQRVWKESSRTTWTPPQPKADTRPASTASKPAPSAGKKNKPTTTKSDARPWSGAELLALHQHALEHGAPKSEKGWEGVIPGRTGASARGAWRKRVLPSVQAYLLSLGN